MREDALQALIVQAARTHGVMNYHTFDSRRSVAGFPDLVLLGRSGILYRELKTETGRISPDQERWLCALREAGEDADVWRPSDWPDRIVSEIRALGRVTVQKPVPTQAEVRRRLQRGGTRKVPNVDILGVERN